MGHKVCTSGCPQRRNDCLTQSFLCSAAVHKHQLRKHMKRVRIQNIVTSCSRACSLSHRCAITLRMYSIFYWMHLFDCPFCVRSGFAAAHKHEMFGWHGPVSYPSLLQSQESLIELVWYIWLSLLFSLAPTPSFLGHAHHRERGLGLHPTQE